MTAYFYFIFVFIVVTILSSSQLLAVNLPVFDLFSFVLWVHLYSGEYKAVSTFILLSRLLHSFL